MTTDDPRTGTFARCASALSTCSAMETDDAVVARGDSLEMVGLLPDDSVHLIIADPPYHSTKKRTITGDRSFRTDEDYLDWMSRHANQWRRVLVTRGTLYVFCSSAMAGKLETRLSQWFRPLSHIVWTKPNEPGFDGWGRKADKQALRKWWPQSERILMFEQRTRGAGEVIREARLAADLSAVQVADAVGAHGRVNHGGAVANWERGANRPTEEQWTRLLAVLGTTDELRADFEREREVCRRVMRIPAEGPYGDVWDFPTVKPHAGKHPAEKPAAMLEHIIRTSSDPGDIVLDPFAGSGSTTLAALRLDRRAIAMEIDNQWIDRIVASLLGSVYSSK